MNGEEDMLSNIPEIHCTENGQCDKESLWKEIVGPQYLEWVGFPSTLGESETSGIDHPLPDLPRGRSRFAQFFAENEHLWRQQELEFQNATLLTGQRRTLSPKDRLTKVATVWISSPDSEMGRMQSISRETQLYSDDSHLQHDRTCIESVATNRIRAIWQPDEFSLPVPVPYFPPHFPPPEPQFQPPSQHPELSPIQRPQFTDQSIQEYMSPPIRMIPFSPPHIYAFQYGPNEHNWPLIHEIYGTAIGIILKCMDREIDCERLNSLYQDEWLQSQGLPIPATRWILEGYYFGQPLFVAAGDRVFNAVMRRRELKEKIRLGVDSSQWPGDTDFCELRNACESIRRKALEFLERWGDLFEQEWIAVRRSRRNENYAG